MNNLHVFLNDAVNIFELVNDEEKVRVNSAGLQNERKHTRRIILVETEHSGFLFVFVCWWL